MSEKKIDRERLNEILKQKQGNTIVEKSIDLNIGGQQRAMPISKPPQSLLDKITKPKNKK